MGTSVEPQPVAPNPPGGAKIVESSFLAQENQLLTIVQQYMAPAEVEQVSLAFQLAQETCKDVQDSLSPTSIPPLEHALAVATILADMHIDAVGVALDSCSRPSTQNAWRSNVSRAHWVRL